MRTILLVSFLLLAQLAAHCQGFSTNNINGNLIDANGNNFIMKGMNVPLAWYVGNVNGSIDDLRKNTNSNCLRIVVQTNTPDASWQTCVQYCIDNDIIPMVELHDVTGNTDQNRMVDMGKFWASKAAYLTSPSIAKYILINICNEWGTWQTANTGGTSWRDATINSVKAMRDAGIKTTIVCDAVGYGQDIDDAKNIRAYAKAIQTADAGYLGGNANLLFSIHMYCEWKKGGDNIGIIKTIKDSGIPIIVGEFGYQHASDGSCDIDEQLIINTCEANGIGWLAWSQKGNGSPVEYLDLCNDWECTSLSAWGNTVINGTNGTKTAKTCTVFLDNQVTPTVTITAPAATSSTCVGTAIAISASASIASGTVTKVDFYDGTTLLGSDNSSPYSYNWANPSAGSHTIRAIATSALNATSPEATVAITVSAPEVVDPYVQIDGGAWTATDTVLVSAGQSVKVGPHPVVDNGWTWTGPANFTATTREISLSPIATASAGTYTATLTNNGCTSSGKLVIILPQGISLRAGWNIIGCPLSTSTELATALASIWPQVETVKNLDSFYMATNPQPLNSLKTVEWGQGYLVKVKTACVLTWK